MSTEDINDLPVPTKYDLSGLPVPKKNKTQDVLSQIPGGATSPPGTYSSQIPEGPSVFERGLQSVAAVPFIGGGAKLAQMGLGAQRLYGTGTASRVGSQLLSALQPKTVSEAAKMAGGAYATGVAGGTAEQIAKSQGAGPVVTQLAGMAGEMIPGLVTYPVGRAIEQAVTPLIPSMRQRVAESITRRLPETVREGGIPEIAQTRQQRLAAAKEELRGGAGTGGAITVGRQLEDRANQLIQDLRTATADRVQKLQQDFDSSIRGIQDQSVKDAQIAVNRAFQAGARVRQNAAGLGAQKVQEAEQIARRIEQEAADAAQQEATRVRGQIDDLVRRQAEARQMASQETERAAGGFGALGERVTLTPIGQEARDVADARLKSLKETRTSQVKSDLDEINKAVTARGSQSAADVPSATEFSDLIKQKLGGGAVPGQVDPQRAPALRKLFGDVTGVTQQVDEATGQVMTVTKPVSFNTLEEIRRRLRDRSYGADEGFAAIGATEATQLANAVEKMQRDFVGNDLMGRYLTNYSQASKPINQYYTLQGKVLTEQTPFGERFITDPVKIPAKLFSSQESVRTFTDLVGGDQALVNNLATKYLNDQMRGGTAQDVARAIDSNRDWLALPQFGDLRSQLTNLQARLAQAEASAVRFGAASKAAEAEIGQLAGKLAPQQVGEITAATKVREQGAKAAEELSKRAAERVTRFLEPRQEALRLAKESAAERMRKQVTEARGQLAGRVSDIEKEASKQADEIRKNLTFGNQNASDEFYKRLTGSSSQSDIEAMASAVRQVPESAEAFKSAVRESLSRVDESKLLSLFDRNIEPALRASGLYRPDELAEVRALVEAVDTARGAIARATAAAGKAVGTMTPEQAFTDEIRKEVVKARTGQATLTGVLAAGGALAGLGGQSLYTALGIPAAVGGVFGTQAIRGDYGPALRRAVAGIVSNPQELRRVLAAPESQRPGLIMTLARNILTAEAGAGAADIMSLIGEDNAAQKR
jgi:hypothetical protein